MPILSRLLMFLKTEHMFLMGIHFSNALVFLDLNFQSLNGRNVHSGNIERIPIKEKSKFPQNFFPEVTINFVLDFGCVF